jgi:hypothetical protein
MAKNTKKRRPKPRWLVGLAAVPWEVGLAALLV